jgi:MFS family permease
MNKQGIIVSVQRISILSALNITVVSTAMPSILKDVGKSNAWVCIANTYFLNMTAFQPLFGQATCRSAPSPVALIAGRAIQGAGSGAISILTEINIADLVPLRERPQYMSIVRSVIVQLRVFDPLLGDSLPSMPLDDGM